MTRRLLGRFWHAVDTEGVVLFQFVFGAWFIGGGINGALVADFQPPLTLQGQMDTYSIEAWYCLLVVGPIIALLGRVAYGRLRYAGMWLCLTGDLVITLELLAYITGTVHVESLGKGGFGAFTAGALCTSGGLTLLRDVRRLGGIEKKIR